MKKTISELTAEINEARASREEAKKANSLKDDFPKLKRSYKYRPSTQF